MFQFRRFPSYTYFVQCRMTGYCPAGLPHSEICGSKDICSSPQLIAACHVLLRLLMPRHSPCALFSLTWRRRKVRLPPFPLSAKTLTAPLLLLFHQKSIGFLMRGTGDYVLRSDSIREILVLSRIIVATLLGSLYSLYPLPKQKNL